METPPQSPLNLLAHVAEDDQETATPEAVLNGRFKDWTRSQLQLYVNRLTSSTGKYATYSRLKIVERILMLERQQSGRSSDKRRKFSEVVEITPQLVNLVSPAGAATSGPTPSPTSAASLEAILVGKRRMSKAPRRWPSLDVAASFKDETETEGGGRLCENAACRARLGGGEFFCRRCSCCICKSFDDNKDPCMWMECSSAACGMSCHIECALRSNSAGVVKQGDTVQLDGGYVCRGCGWISHVLGSWRKLLIFARNSRRTDAFTSRLSLAFRLLHGTMRYKELHEIVVEAAKKLEQGNGPLGSPSSRLGRSLVTRLSGAAEVQNLVEAAINRSNCSPFTDMKDCEQKIYVARGEALERVYTIQFQEITVESMVILWTGAEAILGEEVVGHSIWCRAAAAPTFPNDPVRIVSSGEESKAAITGLYPGIEYVVKVVPVTRSRLEVGKVEARCCTAEQEPDMAAVYEASRRFDEGVLDHPFRIRDVGKLFNFPSAEQRQNNTTRKNQVVVSSSAKCFDDSLTSETVKTATDQQHDTGTQQHDDKGVERLKTPVQQHQQQQHETVVKNPTSTQHETVVKNPTATQHETADEIRPEVRQNETVQQQQQQQQQQKTRVVKVKRLLDLNETIAETFNCTVNKQNSKSAAPRETSSSGKGRQAQMVSTVIDIDDDDDESDENGGDSLDFSVRRIVWLEQQKYLTRRFRLKLLTWLGFQASEEERGVFFVLVRTLMDDPASLAEQLVDTFQEIAASAPDLLTRVSRRVKS